MIGYIDRRYSRGGIHGRVVHEVGHEIVAGRFAEGAFLPKEDFFMDRFNGSRTAIREAFRVLTAKGLLEAKQRAGTSVRARAFWNLWDPDVISWHHAKILSLSQAKQLMQVRMIVEPEAARLHALKQKDMGNSTILQKICLTMDRAWEEGNISKAQDSELAFHSFLVEGCGNEYLARTGDLIRLSISYAHTQRPIILEKKLGPSRWYGQLVEKIKARDPLKASEVVRSLMLKDTEFLSNKKEVHPRDKTAVAS